MSQDNVLKAGVTLQNGKFVIRCKLGQGGFGITYEATQVNLKKRVALKECFWRDICTRSRDGKTVVPTVKANKELFEKQKEKFLSEAIRMASLRNSHFVPVSDTFEENGTVYYVMDFIEGKSLGDWLKNASEPLDEERVMSILEQMLDALECIHNLKPPLVHLDIKPDNIMMEGVDKAVLVDFGASKYVSNPDGSMTTSSLLFMTPGYAPFELMDGEICDIGPWTDIYSLGATLFCLLTGKKPSKPSKILADPTPEKQYSIPLPNSLSPGMRKLILWMMVLNISDRPQSVEEIRDFIRKHGLAGHSNRSYPPKAFKDKNEEEGGDDNDVEIIVVETSEDLKEKNKKAHGGDPSAKQASLRQGKKALHPILQNLVNNMVQVEGGTFMMGATPEQGSDAKIKEKPAHQVTVSSFSIGRYLVTQEEWKTVMGDNPSYFKGDKNPVENVSWDNCQEFISKLNALTGKRFRLPTEAEWEFAARGGKMSRHYKYAGSNDVDHVTWHSENSNTSAHPVGMKKPNELGLYDMSGNVWEWCSDWYGPYTASSQTNPKGPASGAYRVIRGGGWYYSAKYCRVSIRRNYTPTNTYFNLGFRLAL